MARAGPDGSSNRATWEYAAAMGSEAALGKLEGPSCPDSLLYLWVWASDLFGKSGISELGVNPLRYETVFAWAVLMDEWPTPWEVRAIMKVDAALRRGEGALPQTDDGEEVPVSREIKDPWPTRGG